MTKPKPPSLIDSVLARASRSRHGPPPWHSALPEEVQAKLADIKERWRAGELKAGDQTIRKNKLAKAIREELLERGFSVVQTAGIVRWLDAEV